jgi:hypothetical protein
MTQAQQRVPPEHARPGITHHDPDLLTVGALIAMDGAIGARRFGRAKTAPLQPRQGVIQERPAVRAQPRLVMPVMAVEMNHRLQRSALVIEALAGDSWRRGGSGRPPVSPPARWNGQVHPDMIAGRHACRLDPGQPSSRFPEPPVDASGQGFGRFEAPHAGPQPRNCRDNRSHGRDPYCRGGSGRWRALQLRIGFAKKNTPPFAVCNCPLNGRTSRNLCGSFRLPVKACRPLPQHRSLELSTIVQRRCY